MSYDPTEYLVDWRSTAVSYVLVALTWLGLFGSQALYSAGTAVEQHAERLNVSMHWCDRV